MARQTDDLLPTRHTLLRRLQDWNDQASWEEFFNTYWRLIYQTALQAGLTEEEAQDVVQETVLTVAKKIKDFHVGSEHGSFKSWLLHTTRWRITDQFRKRAPGNVSGPSPAEEGTRNSTTEGIPDPGSLELEAAWERDWEQTLVEAATARVKRQVDPALYQIFDLHVLKQWPATKVAEKCGVKLAKVYVAKYKVTRRIKKEVKLMEKQSF